MRKMRQNRIFRFLICGIITAIFNLLLIAAVIKGFQIEQPLWRNVANVIAIEISLLFSFFVYRIWVWTRKNWLFSDLRREIPLYHLSCGLAIAVRSLLLFPILDWLGVNYLFNTLFGIVIGSSMNYVFSDRLVFKSK